MIPELTMMLPLLRLLFAMSLVPVVAAGEELTYTPYVNRDECYTISFPNTWSVQVVDETDDIMSTSPSEGPDDKITESVEIWVAAIDDPESLASYFQRSMKNLKRHASHFQLIEQGRETIDGVEARWMLAILTEGGVTGQLLQYQMLVDGRIYMLNFTAEPNAYGRFESIFKTIAHSFLFSACAP